MSKHIVTAIKPFDFMDDKDKHISGVKVYYFDSEPETDGDALGYFPLNLTLPLEHAGKFVAVPGVYEMDFKQKSDAKGKPVLALRKIEYVSPVEFVYG
ncbi:MAG: hypothetical protein K2P90_01390 [Holosporales bacterium]|nr:hypothetical protein [Holosporales bacterium]